MNRILMLIAATAIGALFTAASYVEGVHAAPRSAPQPVLHGVVRTATMTPCPTEDSINCYWNDGTGHAFYSVRVGALSPRGRHYTQDCIIYWDRAYNRTYGQCYRVR